MPTTTEKKIELLQQQQHADNKPRKKLSNQKI